MVVFAAAIFVRGLAAQPEADVAAWDQFRGSGGSGVAADARPPVAIDPSKAAWSIPVPPGHSSPVLTNDLIVITAFDEGRLVTLAYKRTNGEMAWRKEAPQTSIEKVHQTSSPAASSPCVDGERIYVYFGSYGLLCYDHQGREVWSKKIPTPQSLYGMSTSPVLHGDLLMLVLDNDANMEGGRLSQSKVIALKKATGEPAWEAHRPLHRSGWSTPAIWKHDQGVELVVLGNGRLCGYDVATGVEKWFVKGFSRETAATPIVGDGVVYAAAAMIGGVANDQPDPEPFWKAVMLFDADKDGKLARDEMTEHFTFPFRPDLPKEHPGFGLPMPQDKKQRKQRLDGMFNNIDKDKDGFWSREEFLSVISFDRGKPNLLAVRPGGKGDVTQSHVAWALHRAIPEIPSPILREQRIYLVRDGGILAAVDARTGKIVYSERLGAGGHYRASPVIAGDHLYLISEEGILSVVKIGDKFELAHQTALKETVSSTPALDASTLYIRTRTRLSAYRSGR